ncbi:hypothetical protein ASF17_08900 [Frigoribacterium sp. Leaf263]|uniref:hypothetical protein n=1 Tax=Frigoribacterium sp. Leaf263 TaxID=1736313 RepID=UPI0006F4E470|nr:hypothetical protein [Frigoribacterium sp. Leaf263]KQO83060.1 hypothetical protein ASF17_08900 [Frigoribacterium sp. Leaf263]
MSTTETTTAETTETTETTGTTGASRSTLRERARDEEAQAGLRAEAHLERRVEMRAVATDGRGRRDGTAS